MGITMIVDRTELEDLLGRVSNLDARLAAILEFYGERFEQVPDAVGPFGLLELEINDSARSLFERAGAFREKYFGK